MSTYTPIASQTLGSAAASITFSSIPQGYTDLILIVSAGETVTNYSYSIVLNSDTSSNYSYTQMYGNGSSASSNRGSNETKVSLYGINSGTSIVQFQNYSNTTTYKSALSRGGNNANVVVRAHLWRSTSAINSMLITADGTSFTTGSTFSLYGIQVGNAAQKAQGGNIVTSDGTYVYHAFTSSGYFIPNAALTADILVVAGGGGGSTYAAGGGGAGGVLPFTSQTLSAQSYNVVVGAGGIGSQVASGSYGTSGNDSQFGSLTLIKGGGYGMAYFNNNGVNGGSGGGSAGAISTTLTGGSPVSGQGNSGGGSIDATGSGTSGGGGGGAGSAGVTSSSTQSGSAGGAGLNTWSSWLSATSLGVSGYIAGGGGAGGVPSGGAGGSGGGGNGSVLNTSAVSGVANTGSGGGGVWYGGTGGNGGSGLVIVRYLA
jgi:hypothetical protein